jgi:hypothetical protein
VDVSLEVQAGPTGWSAEQVEARAMRDDAGDPAIEIQGRLRGTGRALPQVEVVLVDEAGHSLGAIEARVGIAAPGPDRVEAPLLAASEPGGAVFAALLPEPPARAMRFRIALSPAVEPAPAPPADATTTASPAPDPGTTPLTGGEPGGSTLPPAALDP